MNKEFNGFDDMVEALEENEDMVECKECFELFPKVDCEKSDIGYVCPVCRGLRTPVAQAKFEDPYDCYTQDFPEVQDYDPGTMTDYEEEPSLGDALFDLIKDEYEAIEGYEVADETIQHADIDEDEKDEILDTLDHIKEEEEEHIDELKELCPECDPEAEPKAEPEKLEEAAEEEEATDEEPEAEEIPEEGAEDPEENENEEVSDFDAAYETALEVANEKGVGQVFGYASVDDEAFVAIEPFDVDDAEAVEDDLRAVYEDVKYAYVAYPETGLEEALFEGSETAKEELKPDSDVSEKADPEVFTETGIETLTETMEEADNKVTASEIPEEDAGVIEIENPNEIEEVEEAVESVKTKEDPKTHKTTEKVAEELTALAAEHQKAGTELTLAEVRAIVDKYIPLNITESAVGDIKNMTSALIESVLNLSPADFAECTDSSRVELWGLEEAEDGVAHAVLIKSYDNVSDEDIQSCHEEMLKLDGMFTFSFTKSGKPAIYGWNVEQLRELTQAGVKGISFDNPAYEEALSLAWRIK